MSAPRPRRRRRPRWASLPHDKLLDMRICDLGLELEGTALAGRIEKLYGELERKGLRFRPYVWLSSDWFTPDDLTGFAAPFYLADRRLVRMEHREMLEVEGADIETCMRILRHEAAHALDNAYHLHRRRKWREAFGRFSDPYRDTYVPDPSSRDFVLNLDYWYSQSHPAEDWAETFAVWLQPGSRWRKQYAGWPVLRKLEYVDELMREIRDRPPLERTRARPESLSRIRYTLRDYYARKQEIYSDDGPTDYDVYVDRLFSDDPAYARHGSAAAFLNGRRRELRRHVANMTGQHQYVVNQALNELVMRCRRRHLRLVRPPRETMLDAAVVLTTLCMQFVYGGHPQYKR